MAHPLDDWLSTRKPPRDRQWLADQLGVHESTLSRIINGKQWPSRDLVRDIVRLTKSEITANDFMETGRAA